MSVPKLRFKEFDGKWSAQKYKDALIIKYGKDHKLLEDGEIPVYGTGGVMRYVNQYLYDGESILIGRKGTIDQPKYVNEKFWTVDTLFYSEIKQNIYPLFIYQHALQVNWLGLNEATGVPSLNTTSINNVDIYLPSKPEQTKIASFLSAVDEKISQLTQKHELLSQYKQGMMQKLFSQQIRFKADDGSEFGEWDKKNLVDISNIITGTTPETANKSFYNGSYLFVSPVDIQENRYISQTKTTLTESGFRKCRAIPKNSILFVCIGSTIGKVAQNKKICATNQQINAVIPNDEYCADYVYFQLLLQAQSIKLKAGTQAVPIINKTEFGKTTLLMPCLEEQIKIANFLSAIDQKIEVVAQQLEQAKQWKKGLLQQMFV